jgi:hypothetical protein
VAILASVSRVSAAPLGDTAKVTVTPELVSLYGVPLMARAALTEQRVGWKIEPLMEALTDRRSHLSEGPSTQAGDLRCVLDVAPSVEFLMVKRVLYTCIDAGYRSIEFVGRGKPLSRGFTSHDGHIEITLIVTEHGFQLLASPGTSIVVSDAKSLAEQLAALRRLYPRESHLLIRIEDSVMYAKVREADQLVTAAGFSEVLLISTLPEETTYGRDIRRVLMTRSTQSQQMRASIQATIRAHLSEVRTCFEAGLSRNPQIQGRVLVYFHVDPTGFVVHANIQSSTLRDQEVEICLISAVRSWKFDKMEGGAVVTYPFVLRAE